MFPLAIAIAEAATAITVLRRISEMMRYCICLLGIVLAACDASEPRKVTPVDASPVSKTQAESHPLALSQEKATPAVIVQNSSAEDDTGPGIPISVTATIGGAVPSISPTAIVEIAENASAYLARKYEELPKRHQNENNGSDKLDGDGAQRKPAAKTKPPVHPQDEPPSVRRIRGSTSEALIFTKADCKPCDELEAHLKANDVPFEKREIDKERVAAAEHELLSGDKAVVPLAVIGRVKIIGFSAEDIDRALARRRTSMRAEQSVQHVDKRELLEPSLSRRAAHHRMGRSLATRRP